jgi:hypothetical protein
MTSRRTFVTIAALLGNGPLVAQTAAPTANRIVHDYRSLLESPVAFVIPDTPHVRIEPKSGDGLILSGRPTLVILRDRRIAIAARDVGGDGRHSIYLFDTTGQLLRREPIRGGAFRAGIERLLELPDGSLLGAGRSGWTVFNDAGRIRFTASDNPSVAIGTLTGGSLLVGTRAVMGEHWAVDSSRFAMASVTYARASTHGQTVTPIPITTKRPLTLVRQSESIAELSPWPVATGTPVATANDVVWTFDAMKWEGRVYDTSGVVRATFIPPEPRRLAGAHHGGRYSRDSVGRVDILADDVGRLWMETGDPPLAGDRPSASRTWWVFDVTGVLLGSVKMPRGFRLLHVSGNWALGLVDRAGAPTSVAQYRIAPRLDRGKSNPR